MQLTITDIVYISKIICSKENTKIIDGVFPAVCDDRVSYDNMHHTISNIEMVLVRDSLREPNDYLPFRYPFEYNEVLYVKAEDGIVKKAVDFSEAILKIEHIVNCRSLAEAQSAYDSFLSNCDDSKLFESICPFEDIYYYNSRN